MKCLISLLSLFFIVYGQLLSQTHLAGTYFPLKTGNEWTYITPDGQVTELVTDSIRLAGRASFLFNHFAGISQVVFRNEDNITYRSMDSVEYAWYKFDADSGQTWQAPWGAPLPPDHLTSFYMLGKNELIITPAGRYKCIHIAHHLGFDIGTHEWFAPGIGIVKRELITIYGPRQWDLLSSTTTDMKSIPEIKSSLCSLSPNYPNPFNPVTTISFTLVKAAFIALEVMDILGRRIVLLYSGMQAAGEHKVVFDGNQYAGGIYICVLRAEGQKLTTKMTLLK